MSQHQRRLAAALGWIDSSPSPVAAIPRIPRDVAGRFVAQPVSLNGGYQPPPPAAPPSAEEAERQHSQLIAALARAPRVVPNLERD